MLIVSAAAVHTRHASVCRRTHRAELLRATALAGGVIAAMMVTPPRSAVAQTGGGGGAYRVDFFGSGSNAAGGLSSATAAGGSGETAPIAVGSVDNGGAKGGGGGGAGVTGGFGGGGLRSSTVTNAGGMGGLAAGAFGSRGADGQGGSFSISGTSFSNTSGGGGGGGGAHGFVGAILPTATAPNFTTLTNTIAGGNGGDGGNGFIIRDSGGNAVGGNGHGGGGGAGGYGAVITGTGDLGTLTVNVLGGQGGAGGDAYLGNNSSRGLGGAGGIGLAFTNNAAIAINTTVEGGASGGPRQSANVSGQNFLSAGVGISGSASGLQLTLGANAVVKGGPVLNELYWPIVVDKGPRTTAIVFNGTSTNNKLTVTNGAVITGGILIAEAQGRLELFQQTDATLSAVISGAGSVIKTGSGILTLTGANVYTGATTVSGGTVRLGAGGSLSSSSVVTIASGATFDFGATQQHLSTLGGLGSGSYGGALNVTLNADETATADLGGTSFALTKDGTGVLTLSGNLTYGGQTLISGGTLNLTGNNALTGGIVVNGKLIIGSSNAAGGAGNTIRTTGSVIAYANGVNNATPITIASNTTQLEVLTGSATQSGVISEDGAGRPIEKIGAGALEFLGAQPGQPLINTYSGPTTITAGTLRISDTRNLGDGSATNRLILNGGTLQNRATVTIARGVTVNAAGGTILADDNTGALQALVLSNGVQFVGGGLLAKTGNGQLHVAGVGSGSGLLELQQGSLFLNSSAAIGEAALRVRGMGLPTLSTTGTVTFANAITLDTNLLVSNATGTALTLSGPISGAGNLQKTNAGALNLTGDNSFTGGVTLGSGTLGVGSNTALGTAAASVQTGATLQALANVSLSNNIQMTTGAFGSNQFIVDTNGYNMTLGGVISTTVPANEPANVQPGLTKNGQGTLTLSGVNTYRGATLVAAGKLVVNGSIANTASVTIANGATLGGNAALPNLTVQSGASLSPGNSVGTVTVAGNLTLNAGSTTVIEIQGATSDRINAGGTATIAGALQLVALGGPYQFGSPYTFLTATGGLSGSFATISTDAAFGVGVTSAVSVTGTSASVTLTAAPLVIAPTGAANRPVLGLTQTRNITAVASGLDRAATAGADVSSLFPVYNQPSREALAAAVNSLSGEVHTNAAAIGYRASDQFLRVMLDPFALGRDGALMGGGASGYTADLPGRKGQVLAPSARVAVEPNYNVWAAAFGATGTTNSDATRVGFAKRELNDANVAVGADFRVMPGAAVGFALSGGQANAKLANGMGTMEAGMFQAGLYGSAQYGALRLGASASYGSMQIETRRSIAVLGQGLVADYRADVLGGRLQAAYEVFSVNGFTVSPFAVLQVQSVRTPNFREANAMTGAGAGVNGQGRTNTAIRSELGLKTTMVTSLAGRRMTLFSEIGWGHDYLRDMTFAATLASVPSASFVVAGARQDRDVALVAAGFEYQLTPSTVLGGRFDGSASSNSRTYAGSASMRMSF